VITDYFVNFETSSIFCWQSNVLTAGQVEETGDSEDLDAQSSAAQSLTNEVELIRGKHIYSQLFVVIYTFAEMPTFENKK